MELLNAVRKASLVTFSDDNSGSRTNPESSGSRPFVWSVSTALHISFAEKRFQYVFHKIGNAAFAFAEEAI